MWVDAGDDDLGVDLVAVLEHDAVSAAVGHQQFRHAGAEADLGTEVARRAGDRLGHLAGAAAAEAPGAERAVDLTHVVMQENVGGAG